MFSCVEIWCKLTDAMCTSPWSLHDVEGGGGGGSIDNTDHTKWHAMPRNAVKRRDLFPFHSPGGVTFTLHTEPHHY